MAHPAMEMKPKSGDSRPRALPWLVVAVCWLALSVAYSGRGAFGLVMPVWEAEFGWSRSFTSTGGAVALTVMAVMVPLSGWLLDRFGPRAVISAGLILFSLGMAAVSLISAPWHLIAAYGVLGGLGFGIVAYHNASTTVAHYFRGNLGLAAGVATSGSTAGQLAVVPLFAAMMTVLGWQAGYRTLAVVGLLLVPLCLFVLRGPGGRDAGEAHNGNAKTSAMPFSEALAFLFGNRVFYALLASFTICGFTTAGVIVTHLLPYAAACGFPPLPSATAYGVLSGVNLGSMILAGWLADRMNRPLLLAAIYGVRAFAFVLLMYIGADISLLFVFAVLFGLVDLSTVPVTASLVATHLGRRIMGFAMGLVAGGHALGAAVGALAGGVLFDLFSRYGWVWIISMGMSLAAAMISLSIRERREAEAVPA